MAKFLLQIVDNGHYSEDVAVIDRLISERNWLYPDDTISVESCTLAELPSKITTDVTPVGTIEFINEVLKLGHGFAPMKPINIPKSLWRAEYLWRKCAVVNSAEEIRQKFSQWNASKLFIKSNSKLKADYTDIYSPTDTLPEDTEYFVSEVVDFVSEWRCFVYRGQLKGIKNYLGDPWTPPNKNFVGDCIQEIGQDIIAYTLDVGVTASGETAVIEVHNFVSCGLYGFADPAIIPMLINGFRREVEIGTKIFANEIPEQYMCRGSYEAGGFRTISPIGIEINKMELEEIACPCCGEKALRIKDYGYDFFSDFVVGCDNCEWDAPVMHLSDYGETPCEFKKWLEAFYLLGKPKERLNEDLTLLFYPDNGWREKERKEREEEKNG